MNGKIQISFTKFCVAAQELEPIFLSLKKRQGGARAIKTAQVWAQIIARLELGDSLKAFA